MANDGSLSVMENFDLEKRFGPLEVINGLRILDHEPFSIFFGDFF